MLVEHLCNRKLFWHLTSRPVAALLFAITIISAAAAGLGGLVKDTSVKAFIPQGHPSLIADQRAREIFGLSDSIAVALVTLDERTIFETETLALIAELSTRIGELPNIIPDRITSITTESSIIGEDGAVLVDPYFNPEPNDAEASSALVRWQQMVPHQGTLVSNDATAAVIVAELADTSNASTTYSTIQEIVGAINRSDIAVHIAGPGAVSGLLSEYIDRDARRLQPLVFALVLGFIYLAFRKTGALVGPLLVVIGAAAGTLGIMAWLGVPYYAITNALPVIVVAISVADAIHILSTFYRHQALNPEASVRELVVSSMCEMSRPVTLTTLTTIAGFVGIATASIMPPVTSFALFAALGVLLAWFFSMFALPNVLVLLSLSPSPAFQNWTESRPSGIGQFLALIGAFAARRHGFVLTVFAVMAVVAIFGVLQLSIDRSQIDNFAADAPIRQADQLINETFAGTAFLDVIVETDTVDGLLAPGRMQKLVVLQEYFESLPHVKKTVSIADYLGLLHSAIENNAISTSHRIIPETDNAIAQYLLVYEASGDPTDFAEEIDSGYQYALIRGALDEPHFSRNRSSVEALDRYLIEEFNEAGMTAKLAGDVNVSYHWMKSLQASHFLGIALSLTLVFITSAFVFRDTAAGLIAVVPVCFAVLALYACMGYLGIYLEPATSMFAAIALGVGVDFAIHLVDRLSISLRSNGGDLAAAIDVALPATARACYFNSAALGLGFSVLMFSNLPTLQRFGGLITIATVSSFLAALIIVPALFAARRSHIRRRLQVGRTRSGRLLVVLTCTAVAPWLSDQGYADELQADYVAAQVAARGESAAATRLIDMTLTDRRGRVRERKALVMKQIGDGTRYTRITYLAPKSVRQVAFLSHDSIESQKAADRWLYMPATRKVRRIPASDRGDYFLGTDFTYEDIQSELKFDLADYSFSYQGTRLSNGRRQHRISGTPLTTRIAAELGYGSFDATIDEDSWMPVSIEFQDPDLNPLKTVTVHAYEMVGDIWTATEIEAVNHQSEHRTKFLISDVRYPESLPIDLFEPASLARGLPAATGY